MASSRDWVCIRLTSYEDRDEYEYLAALYNDGLNGLETIFDVLSGVAENTTFGLLGPDGATRLSCVGRDPHFVLDTIRVAGGCDGGSGDPPQRLATVLRELAARHTPTAPLSALPKSLDWRRALNAAACDDQPLVLVRAAQDPARDELENRLAALAWSEAFVGRFLYAVSEDAEGLAASADEPGVFVLQPGPFGLTGTVLARAPLDADEGELAAALQRGLGRYDRAVLSREEHLAAGLRAGATWECPFPPQAPCELSER